MMNIRKLYRLVVNILKDPDALLDWVDLALFLGFIVFVIFALVKDY